MKTCGGVLLLALLACAHRAQPGTDRTGAMGGSADTTGWRTEALDERAPGPPALLTAVEVRPGAGFDRVAFDFAGRVPGYRVAFEPAPVHRCGSGDPLELPGGAILVVSFRGTAAHDDAGRATVTDRDRRPGLDAVRALTLFCDFEGDVSWAVALPGPARFRVRQPAGSSRLIVDVEHTR